ncbi:MAG TPA: hypothetical protein VFZ10_19700 [Geminicoccaceae bacterium]
MAIDPARAAVTLRRQRPAKPEGSWLETVPGLAVRAVEHEQAHGAMGIALIN